MAVRSLRLHLNINGRYLSTKAMSGCPESTRVLLTILQSEVYLNCAVDVVENAAVIEKVTSEARPPLSGRLAQPQVTLDGRTSALSRCQPLARRIQVAGTIASEVDKKLSFAGTILLDSVRSRGKLRRCVWLSRNKKKDIENGKYRLVRFFGGRSGDRHPHWWFGDAVERSFCDGSKVRKLC